MIHRFLPSLPSFPSLSRLLFIFPASILLLALMPALCAVPAPDNKPLEDWTLHRPASTPADAIGIRETDTTTGAPVFILRRTAAGTTVAHIWWGHTRATRPGETWHLRYEARARPLASSDDGGGGGGGDDGEYNAYVNVTWQGMDRQWLGAQPLHTIARHSVRWPNASRPAVPDWKTFDVTFTPPATATALGIRLAIDNTGASEAAFRNITLRKVGCTVEETLACLPEKIPVYRIPARPVTANGVTLTPDWTLDGAPVTRSATRFKVPLNALWAIQPSPPPLTHTAATASSSAAASMIPPPRDDDWAFFKVPGYFNRRLYSVYGQDKTTWAARNLYSDPVGLWYVRDVQIPALDAPSSADGILHFEVGGMWGYSVRAYWDGQPLGNITDQLGGRLPLPPTVRPGDRGQLALYALRVPPERRDAWRPDYIRAHNPDATFAGDQSKGFHDLYLTLQPRAARIDGIKLSPTVRPPDIALGLHLASPVPALSPAPASAQPVRYHLAIRDAGGRTVLARELGPGAPDQDGITWQIPWQTPDASPRLWTPDDPYLHTAIIQARSAAASDAGRLLDESLPIPFGLREVYVDGRELRFNGHPFRIRPRITLLQFADNASIRRQISFLKDMGFNCLIRAQAGGGHNLEEEARTSPDAFFSIADELGMMLIPYLPYSLVNGGQFAGDSLSSASGLQSLVHYTGVRQITRFYNHPSIIAWSGFGHSPTRGINPLAIDPAIWGITPLHRPGALDPWIPDPAARADVLRRLDSSRLFVEAIKKLDPSRPFLSHNDSGQGDGWGFFDYLNWTPLQEWEDWPRQWSQKGVMPIGSTEHGLPYPGSFVNHAPAGGDNEPWITEYAAVEQGPAAYERESSSVLDYITRVYDPVVKNYSRDTRNPPHDSGKAAVERAFANVQPVWAARNQAIYRAWRTYGVPMGIEPFGPCNYFLRDEALFKDEGAIIASPDTNLKTTGAKADRWTPRGYWPSETMLDYPEHPAGRPPPARYFKPLGDALVSANSPLLAWIAGGGGGEGEGFTEKSRGFRIGDTIHKQIALVWDGFRALDLEIGWSVTLGGRRVIAPERSSVVLSPGQIRFLPLTFSLPETVLPTSGDADGVIELTVTRRPDNEPVATDTFAFRAYRKQSPDKDLLSARIALYDPAGESGALFTRLGLTPAMIADPARTPADAGLLVIGRRALATLDTAWLSSLPPSLPPALPVLFLEQTDADLERLGFRAYPARPRAVFTLPGGSSLLPPDLRDPELANWNVCPTLLPAGSAPLRDGYNFTNGYQGALASVTIETPTLGNFTPHLQTGFDLRETPLLETTLSGRRLVFCQLSLPEAVGADPVATRIAASLLRNLVAKPGHASTAKRIPLVVTGDERLAALARDLGAAASPVTIFQGQFNDAPAPVPGVALLDGIPEDSRESAALRAWIRGGGRALVLPGSTGSTGSGISSLRRVFPEAPASIDKTITSLAPPPVATTPEAAAFLRGIGQNNLHARQALPVLRFGGGDGDGDGGAPVSVFGVGDGHIVLLGFDPRQIDTTRTPWLKLTRAHQYRVLSQLLTNLGADLSAPASALFAPGAPSRRIEIGDDARARQTRATGADTTDASWTKPGFDDSAWGRFDLKNQKTPDGHALLRIAFRTPATLPPGPLFLDLGTVDDFDETWLNGVKIGATTPANTNPDTAWTVHRLYPVPGDILKTDADTVNVIAIRLWNRNAAAKGWPAWLRGPVSIHPVAPGSSGAPLYIGEHRRVDDPYLQYHW